jgi:hypothetical protein
VGGLGEQPPIGGCSFPLLSFLFLSDQLILFAWCRWWFGLERQPVSSANSYPNLFFFSNKAFPFNLLINDKLINW